MTNPSAPAEVVRALRAELWPADDAIVILKSGLVRQAADLIEAINTRPVASTLDHIGGVFAGEEGMFSAVALDAETVEACARVAESYDSDGFDTGEDARHWIASTIRALSPGKTGSAGVGED